MRASKPITGDHPVELTLSPDIRLDFRRAARATRQRMDRQRIPGNVRLPDYIIPAAEIIEQSGRGLPGRIERGRPTARSSDDTAEQAVFQPAMPDRQNDVGNPDRRVQIERCLDLEQHRSRVKPTNVNYVPEFAALPEGGKVQFERNP